MVSRIYKRMVKFIALIKELRTFFVNEIDKRLIEINDKMKERNEHIEVLKDCTQLNCVYCKFNEMCDFSNLRKRKEINNDKRRERKKD